MKLLVDMNLSPGWIEFIQQGGWEAIHWSSVGNSRATDKIIMDWARENGFSVFTHDLDFGTILAVTGAQKPSVVQVRTQDVMPQTLGNRILQVFHDYESFLDKGAIVTVDEVKSRVHILPFS
jgi:predicted nuclease of predicted toxin-antitoxin system